MARQRKKIRKNKPRHQPSPPKLVDVYDAVRRDNPNATREYIQSETARLYAVQSLMYMQR